MDEAKRQKLTEPQHAPLAKVWLEPQEGRVQLVVFDALTNDGKQFIIWEGIGPDGALEVSPIAQSVIDRLGQVDETDCEVVMVDLAHVERIGPCLAQAFAAARAGAAIMLLCPDSEIMDIIDGLLDLLDCQPPTTPVASRTPGKPEIPPGSRDSGCRCRRNGDYGKSSEVSGHSSQSRRHQNREVSQFD
jgi:hypothetical protein